MMQTIENVVEMLTSVPPFPKATMKLIQLLENDETSARELGEIISSDPALTIKVLHLANSPFYMCSKRISSVQDAVIILGVGTLKGIVTGLAIKSSLDELAPPAHVCDIDAYWRHSFATAIAARDVASREQITDENVAYVVGLIHDIGKIVQARFWPETWITVQNTARDAGCAYEEIEARYFGFKCTDIAEQLSIQWEFPESFIVLIKAAGNDSEHSIDNFEKLSLIRRADMIACAAGFPFPMHSAQLFDESFNQQHQELIENLAENVAHQLQVME